MSNADDFLNLAFAALLLASIGGAAVVYRWLSRRAHARGATRNHVVRLTHERADQARTTDPAAIAASDPLTRDVTALLVAYVLDNPDLADAFARLDQAIREQTKGEQQ